MYLIKGVGKLTYTFSANANVLSVSATWPIPAPPAGNTLNGKLAESMLALEENVYVVLPAPFNKVL